MAIPINREEFKEYCLRKLGHPVIQINVSDEQIDDRVDEALKFYADYHFDAASKIFYKHLITQDDKNNKYISLPVNIIGAVQIYPIADPSIRSDDLFNIKYQMALNDLYSLTGTSLIPYYMAMEHLQLINELLVGKQPMRYQRHKNELHVDMDWNKVNVGEYLLVEAYEVIDPDEYTDVWGDRWLQNYCSVLIKENWGSILTKHVNTVLPGGVQLNGMQIYESALTERNKLEQDVFDNYSLPPEHYVG